MENKRLRARLLLVSFLVCSGIARTQTPSAEAASDLVGPTWQLVKFQSSDDKTLTPDDKAKYTMKFERDGHVSLRLDCNRGRGIWKSTGRNQVEFGPVAMTRAMCPAGSLDGQIAGQLPNVRSYTLKDGHLFLALMADGGIYEFESQGAGGVAALENTSWKLTQLGDTPVDADSVQKKPELTLNSESRRVSGSGGCNRLTGGYQLNGDELTFGQMASTMMACPKGMETEKAFLEALQRVKQWKIKGQELKLLDAEGKVLACFKVRN